MAGKTIEDLRTLRSQMVERRRQEAYRVSDAHDDERIEILMEVHQAIQALNAVIAEGKEGPPEADVSSMDR